MNLQQYKVAQQAFKQAILHCGASLGPEFDRLEESLVGITSIPVRPRIKDFESVAELGEGNFSKIIKVLHMPTNSVFAMKVRTNYYEMFH